MLHSLLIGLQTKQKLDMSLNDAVKKIYCSNETNNKMLLCPKESFPDPRKKVYIYKWVCREVVFLPIIFSKVPPLQPINLEFPPGSSSYGVSQSFLRVIAKVLAICGISSKISNSNIKLE
jgi:hypothetical protein